MDDPSHQSPPSSKKSSVLGKLDRPETPNRGSPYLTRSRKSSTLTEENVAMHNDTPTTRNTTRRVTRRMSQSSESVVLTPMPQIAKRTRRSPSVASGDDVNATPKKKFSVAQENVVIEEDETVEENKLQSTVADTNGSKIENDVDKENINTVVNGSVSEENLQRKSLDSNESNKTGSVVEEPAEPKVATDAVDSNKPNALPVETSAVTTESLKPIVSTAQSSDPSSTSSPNRNTIASPPTVVAVIEQVEPDSTKLSDSPLDTLQKSITETSTATDGELEMTNISPKLNDASQSELTNISPKSNDTSQSELNGTVLEMKTPTKSSELSVSDIIVITDTPNTSIMDEIIVIPETPVQTRQSSITEASLQVKVSQMTGISPVIETPKTVTRQSARKVDSPKTPLQTKKDVLLDVSATITPLSILKPPKAVPDTQTAEFVNSPKTPLQTKEPVTPKVTATVTASLATQETPKSVLDDITPHSTQGVSLTESEEEILLRTPPTPSRLVTELLQSKADVTKTASAADGDNASTPRVSPSKAVPSQNGVQDANDENPKWANSIRRKSDGQPIDKFGVNKANTEVTTLAAKPSKNETSTVSVKDTSEGESSEYAGSNSETEPRNMFLDDEAMESNGEASMDEEERKYLEENEIPEEGISLGSESDEALSEEEESDDSFIVSDSSVQLLDGSGDDLGTENAELNISQNKAKRGNKILDTSDEELESTKEPKKSSKKRRPESSLDRTAKYLRVDSEDEDDNANDGGDEDEMANLDVEPKRVRTKRFSESTSPPKKDKKRLSLHPNIKLSSLESKEQVTLDKNDERSTDDSSEEDVTQELANLDEEPKKTVRSKTLSESLESPKRDVKRMSLHPNTKLSTVESIQKENKQTTEENDPTAVDESSKADNDEELANLDSVPKKSKNKKRLSESNPVSKEETKRLSLHPNTKLSFLESNEDGQEQNQQQQQPQSKLNENDSTRVTETCEDGKGVEEELAHLDDEPKQIGKSKRLSDVASLSKKDTKRLSLHPDTKLNRSGLDVTVDASTVPAPDSNDDENMDMDQSAPSASPPKKEITHSYEEIQAICDEVIQIALEARRLEKLNKKPMQEDKYQKLKEKKTAKLQEKKAKEARELEREVQAAKQRQLKRDKKSRIAEVKEDERAHAIEKALKFSETIEAIKAKHSSRATEKPFIETTVEEPTIKKRKRKPKTLQILNEDSNPTKKKRRVEDTEPLPAKPEGFKINSLPVKSNKVKKNEPKRTVQKTSAGGFDIEPLPRKAVSPFIVTTLEYNPAIKFSSFKDKAIANSNVQRVSAAQLLSRKAGKQKKILKN